MENFTLLHHNMKSEYSTIDILREKECIHIGFIIVYCCNYSILLFVIVANLLL